MFVTHSHTHVFSTLAPIVPFRSIAHYNPTLFLFSTLITKSLEIKRLPTHHRRSCRNENDENSNKQERQQLFCAYNAFARFDHKNAHYSFQAWSEYARSDLALQFLLQIYHPGFLWTTLLSCVPTSPGPGTTRTPHVAVAVNSH